MARARKNTHTLLSHNISRRLHLRLYCLLQHCFIFKQSDMRMIIVVTIRDPGDDKDDSCGRRNDGGHAYFTTAARLQTTASQTAVG